MRRKPTSPPRSTSPRSFDQGTAPKKNMLTTASLAIIAGAFILGIAVGVGFNSGTNFNPQNVASREYIDQAAPSRDVCINYGASAIVTDTRTFVTFNPFKVYISRPLIQPGCILRSNGWAVLEKRKLVSSEQVRECKRRMQTFGYTGKLDNTPQINCVNPSEGEDNKFPNQPGGDAITSDSGF